MREDYRKIGDRECVEGHTIFVTDRGGGNRKMQLIDVSMVRWGRQLDDVSTARVEISGAACRRQSGNLAQIEPRRDELVIYRGDTRVWEGPIRSVEYGLDRVAISADDVLEYVFHRPLTKYWPGPDNGGPSLMGDRIEQIIQYELATNYIAPGASVSVPAWENLTPAINVLPYLDVRPGSVQTRTETYPFEMTVGEHLDTLARGSLDYTTVGRRILIWDRRETIGQTRILSEADFYGTPKIYASGGDLISVMHVVASMDEEDENGDPIPPTSTEHVGSAIRDSEWFYGPWAKLHTRASEDSSNAPSQAALVTQALAQSAGGVPVPVDLAVSSGASLRLDHTLTILDLVPGVEMPVRAELYGRTIQQVLRLKSVSVTENASGEAVTVTLNSNREMEE